MSLYICESCVSKVSANDKFCTGCGAQFAGDAIIKAKGATKIKNLKVDFDPKAKLEIQTEKGSSFVQVAPEFFRSWGGKRKVNGKEFKGPVYKLWTNKIAK